MSIYEYDQEEHIRLEREEAYADGRLDKLKEQVQKKLAKGQTAKEIADVLEENIDDIDKIIKQLQEQGE